VNTCPDCGFTYDSAAETCLTCGAHLGYPNVRAASEEPETKALAKRYEDAVERSKGRGSEDVLHAFENAVQQSHAVVNLELMRLQDFMSDGRVLYTNYHLAVRAEVREAAKAEFDRHRRSVDAMLFGGYADQIRYAALSIDGRGLKSYGPYTLILKDVAVAKRSSVLEENSFDFCKRHALKPGDAIPEGYRAVWVTRQKLAVAKLADLVTSDMEEAAFGALLLYSGPERDADRYIEVQIFGAFNNNAVESVVGSTSSGRFHEVATAAIIKELVIDSGKTWVEE
jgi:hypothetical protein